MPLAVTHVVPVAVLYNFFNKRFSLEKFDFSHAVFVAAAAALLPDMDLILGRVLRSFGYGLAHGSFTHTPFFAFIFFLPAIILFLFKKYRAALFFSLLGSGIIVHIFLDYLIGGGAEEGVMWFFPLSEKFYKIHLLSSLPYEFWPQELDALILLGWIYFKRDLFNF